MTPDRDAGESVLDPTGTPDTTRSDPAGLADLSDLSGLADLAAEVAVGPVPSPRPEVLARVLDGLRELPAARRAPRDDREDAGAGPTTMPLPRRRS
ncbi:hypothetical protein [Actinomycetospora straminea]|uniref:Uncharacterized protein n=1 Tax=Actinomycetospora straminea TaxID=663607 RepID=A0ABP9E0M3_9PSEU|nr:hypothetical protein [Actinomycetospora straminea]MDD7930947.1 hypothetical protein [Actinomycetospora straminea]